MSAAKDAKSIESIKLRHDHRVAKIADDGRDN